MESIVISLAYAVCTVVSAAMAFAVGWGLSSALLTRKAHTWR